MARHGGGHGRRGRHHGHRHGRPRRRIHHPFPVFGFGGRMGFGLMLAPFMGIFFMMMLMSGIISASANFSTILGVLCIVGAFALLYQTLKTPKPKRKNGIYDPEDDTTFYDDDFDNGQII